MSSPARKPESEQAASHVAELVPFDVSSIEPVTAPNSFGPPSNWLWVDASQLRIDPSYQRELKRESITKIRRIGENFSWKLFRTLMIAKVAAGVYAVIDGQHRVLGGLLAGITKFPAELVIATRQEQAAVFSAVNSKVTRVHPLSAFRAEVAAGDLEAVGIVEACTAAGVRVMPYPAQRIHLKPGDTQSVSALKQVYQTGGGDLLVLILRCITSARKPVVGAVSGPVILGLLDAIKDASAWMAKSATLPAVFAECDLLAIAEAKGLEGTGRQRVRQAAEVLCDRDLGPRVPLAIKPKPAQLVIAPAQRHTTVMPKSRKAIGPGPEFDRLCNLAMVHAAKCWAVKFPADEPPRAVRIAVAVALSEFALDTNAVRERFDLEDCILPERSVMPVIAGNLADKIFKHLTESK